VVDEAENSRRWPDTLVVELVEHVPLAHWNGMDLISTEGEVFSASVDAELPRLSGLKAPGPRWSILIGNASRFLPRSGCASAS